MTNFKNFQIFAEKIARQAGNFIQKSKREVSVKKIKDADKLNPLTNIDLKSEELITSAIKEKYPNHNIQSEENVKLEQGSDYTWIIDPLDGTRDYLRDLPEYNVSVAIEYKDKLVAGVVYIPKLNELYSCCYGNLALLNNFVIKTSNVKNLKNALVSIKLPKHSTGVKERKQTLNVIYSLSTSANRLRAFSVDQISLCWVARGALEGFIMTSPGGAKWWDVAPGILMVEEAGGKVTDMYEDKIKNKDLSRGLVASNGKIHKELLKYLKK